MVYGDLIKFWDRSGILTAGKETVVRRIIRLYRDNVKLLKCNKRNTEMEMKKTRSFEAKLYKLFDMAAPNAEK